MAYGIETFDPFGGRSFLSTDSQLTRIIHERNVVTPPSGVQRVRLGRLDTSRHPLVLTMPRGIRWDTSEWNTAVLDAWIEVEGNGGYMLAWGNVDQSGGYNWSTWNLRRWPVNGFLIRVVAYA